MLLLLLGLLLLLPLLELIVIIKVGGAIGVLPTIALLIGMGLLGTVLLRSQGLSTMRKANAALAEGRMPVASVVDAVGLMLAGGLMLMPGLVSDLLGLLLLIPPVRHGLARWLFRRLMRGGQVTMHRTRMRSAGGDADTTVIEGEFTHVEDPPPPSDPRSPRLRGPGRR